MNNILSMHVLFAGKLCVFVEYTTPRTRSMWASFAHISTCVRLLSSQYAELSCCRCCCCWERLVTHTKHSKARLFCALDYSLDDDSSGSGGCGADYGECPLLLRCRTAKSSHESIIHKTCQTAVKTSTTTATKLLLHTHAHKTHHTDWRAGKQAETHWSSRCRRRNKKLKLCL